MGARDQVAGLIKGAFREFGRAGLTEVFRGVREGDRTCPAVTVPACPQCEAACDTKFIESTVNRIESKIGDGFDRGLERERREAEAECLSRSTACDEERIYRDAYFFGGGACLGIGVCVLSWLICGRRRNNGQSNEAAIGDGGIIAPRRRGGGVVA